MSEFEEKLIQALAVEAVKSPVIARAIAEMSKASEKQFNDVVANLDSEEIAEKIARNIVALGWTGRKSDPYSTASLYASIIKKAQERSAELVAEQMAKDVMEIK